jgi:N-acetylglucosamine-6-phosphate deacetylase
MNINEVFYYNANAFYQGELHQGGIRVKNGRILCFESDPLKYKAFKGQKVDLKGRYLFPGFIDIHSHGGQACEFIGAALDINILEKLSKYYASTGTTSVVAGTYTEKYEKIKKAITNISLYIKNQKNEINGAEIVGINIEGPYICEKKCGAQNSEYIRKINLKEFDELIELSGNKIKLITIAPELEGALEGITYLHNKGITVSIGHSIADYDTACQAIVNGASLITHFFNGLNSLHHRNPGVIGAGLASDELTLELICDGYHVHPELIKFLLKTKTADNICFITDSVHPAGCEDGEYILGGLSVIKNGNEITLKQGGNLAGSCLKMIDAFKNAIQFTGLDLQKIIPAFTSTPAKIAKIDDKKGTIEVGKDADFIILDKELNLIFTYVKGVNVYQSVNYLEKISKESV